MLAPMTYPTYKDQANVGYHLIRTAVVGVLRAQPGRQTLQAHQISRLVGLRSDVLRVLLREFVKDGALAGGDGGWYAPGSEL